MTEPLDIDAFLKEHPLSLEEAEACDAETRALICRAARHVANMGHAAKTCPARTCRRAGRCQGQAPFEPGFACGADQGRGFSAAMGLVCFVLMERIDAAAARAGAFS